MTTQWERFNQRSPQTLDALGASNTLEIYNPTSTTKTSDGDWQYDYPGTADATIDGETMNPSAFNEVTDAGTSEGLNLMAFIDSNTSVSFTEYGTPQEGPTRVKNTEDGELYEVQSVVAQGDGYTRLELTET